jgi:hypothetical protein
MPRNDAKMSRLYAPGKHLKPFFIFLGLFFLSQSLFPQESSETIPDMLRRPERGEAPRYGKDLIIGELGQGNAPEKAYNLAQRILSELIAGNADSPLLSVTENLLQNIRSIMPRHYRLGGGRIETDGCVSFLIRFIGQEESIAGELFLRSGTENWYFDDLVLEEKRKLSDIRDGYRYDFSPYERIY